MRQYQYARPYPFMQQPVSGGAKEEENRRFENPVAAARKSGLREVGFTS